MDPATVGYGKETQNNVGMGTFKKMIAAKETFELMAVYLDDIGKGVFIDKESGQQQ